MRDLAIIKGRADHGAKGVELVEPLIVGAGPVGLTAALLLAERGVRTRIVDKLPEPSPYSKAFGVNPRTLTLLERTGVTEQMLAQGWRMSAINVWKGKRRLFRLELSRVEHKYPFMLIHSQAKSEALLSDALTGRGIKVERNVALEALEMHPDYAEVTLRRGDERQEQVSTPVLLGADGSRSAVRRSLSIPFTGSSFDEPWKLYDLELDPPLNRNEAHTFLLEGGGMFVVRLDDRLWRVIGSLPNLLEHLPKGTTVGQIAWESDFGISSRLAKRFQEGCAYLAGDAAHIHSGLGARGMNLGVEDAYVFAALAAEGRLHDYERLRRPVDTAVVRQTERITEVPRGKKRFARVARSLVPLAAPFIPLASKGASRWVLGLDHEVALR